MKHQKHLPSIAISAAFLAIERTSALEQSNALETLTAPARTIGIALEPSTALLPSCNTQSNAPESSTTLFAIMSHPIECTLAVV